MDYNYKSDDLSKLHFSVPESPIGIHETTLQYVKKSVSDALRQVSQPQLALKVSSQFERIFVKK